MTCFWRGILQSINKEDKNLLNFNSNHRDLKGFIQRLKELSVNARFDIKWQNQELSLSEINDLKTYIKEYDINLIHQGHWTSSCDPFLCLLTDLLKCRIEFIYRNHHILFESKNEIRRTLKFRGSQSHFQKI